MAEAPRPPLPPFTEETARAKVAAAQAAWNSKDIDRIAAAYSENSEWRNRAEFVKGRDQIKEFLKRKWERELHYRLRKYLWAYTDNRIAVNFEYEYLAADENQWYRAYGLENWEFDEAGYMRKRIASIVEAPIDEKDRRIAVDEPVYNAWLTEQGVGQEPFPLGGGHVPTYPKK